MLPEPFIPPDAPDPELDPENQHPDTPLPHDPEDDANTLATPEGDNEGTPEQPLNPGEPPATRPRGDQPHTHEPLYPVAY
jgi:hypothetical protein